MKRIIFVLCAVLMISVAFADTNICRKTGTTVIILSKSVDGTSMTSDATTREWSVTFNYTTLSTSSTTSTTMTGLAACNEIAGTANTPNSALVTTTSDQGTHCWCEMLTPAHAYWTFAQTYSSDSDCASNCTGLCANLMKTSTAFRTGVFGGIW